MTKAATPGGDASGRCKRVHYLVSSDTLSHTRRRRERPRRPLATSSNAAEAGSGTV